MLLNINNEIRKQLIGFLNKTLDQSYTQNEWENFAISLYQNDELENIRTLVVNLISNSPNFLNSNKKNISETGKKTIRKLIAELSAVVE